MPAEIALARRKSNVSKGFWVSLFIEEKEELAQSIGETGALFFPAVEAFSIGSHSTNSSLMHCFSLQNKGLPFQKPKIARADVLALFSQSLPLGVER